MNLQWPNLSDFIKDKNQDMPKPGELMDEYCYRVSDLGIPVSEEGMHVCEKLDKEYSKRDQDERDMFIYNDWNGWAMSEVMENLLKDFNRDVFKKTISPFKKWGFVEGLAVFLKTADLMYWMGRPRISFILYSYLPFPDVNGREVLIGRRERRRPRRRRNR